MSTEFFLSGSTRYLTDPNMVRSGVEEGDRWPPAARATTDWRSLLGVVLHDELLLDRDVDLRPDRDLVDEDAHPRRDDLHPRGGDELAGLAARPGEAGAVDHVVEAALEELQEVVAGLALATAGLLVVADELLLHHAVGETSLLLLTELQQVLGLLDATAAVLAGGVGTLLEGGVATDEVDTETARLAGHGTGVAGHVSVSLSQSRSQTRRRLGGRHPLCGVGVTSWMVPTSRPMAPSDRMAVSRPEPGPLTKTSIFFMPWSMARRPAASAAISAAKGVDLREPLKPTVPAEAHEITAPVGSVMVTMVLLNVLLMWASP